MKFRGNANFKEKTTMACKIRLIFVISTSNNILDQNWSGFCEVPYLGLPYRNPTKMWLRCKMNTIFVFGSSNNPSMQGFSQKFCFKDFGASKVE
ncbi:hypothetical protein Y032_0067g55 [Ancylostoma ceylanicum]|uniref:Uncharacterized protein n=1 Tax=Ancylostoma ceylanicum TaxID=53326 RepID=A0A016U0R3_9BILA|nr:hypothetical protein Y032_0067g55 [Ancylostoma ceylanicum]